MIAIHAIVAFLLVQFQAHSANSSAPATASFVSSARQYPQYPQLQQLQQLQTAVFRTSLAAARGDDGDDDDDGDDEPPNISTTPQEFLQRMNQKQTHNNFDAPAYGPGRGRSTPQIRPAFGTKNNSHQAATATVYVCTNCGSEFVQWRGRCGTCMEWNTIQEFRARRKPGASDAKAAAGGGFGGFGSDVRPVFGKSSAKRGSSWLSGIDDGYGDLDGGGGYSGGSFGGGGGPVRVTDVYQQIIPQEEDNEKGEGNGAYGAYAHGARERRVQVPNDPEINAVLGGGIMPGSITLVGGDPGVGKSTLLLQTAGSVASMAERSLQFPGVGMGPPRPSPTSSNSPSPDKIKNDQDSTQGKQQAGCGPVLYISGEENANQIASRALRLGIHDSELLLWCETDADVIADTVVNAMYGPVPPPNDSFDDSEDLQSTKYSKQSKQSAPPLSRPPALIVIDSIQTMLCSAGGSSSVGGITQVRECVGLFLRLAKSTSVPIILVGHVTKSGDVAGPRTVEHMVDCVLYLEGGTSGSTTTFCGSNDGPSGSGSGGGMTSLRILRASKNRFGSSEEVGVYESGIGGRLIPVSDPSSLFLSTRLDHADAEGCAISVALEGIRSMTVEVQALVAWSSGSGAYGGRRIVDGISPSRLLLILAVLQKRYGISFFKRDVYVNVVGGMNLGRGSKRGGGGSDLAVAMAVVSSLVGIPVRSDTAFVGEVGLLGELRPVHSLEKRINEARRMGFSRIVTPALGGGSRKGRGKFGKGSNNYFGPREVSAGGITQVLCENVLDAINCGLIHKLPTRKTMSGPKVRVKKSNDSFDRDQDLDPEGLDIIVDDGPDDAFE